MLKNLFSNYFGQVYSAALNLLLIPVYIKYMGPESVGLLGFSIIITVWINLIDSSISPILIREFTLFGSSKEGGDGLNVLKTIEVIALVISFAIISFTFITSNWFTEVWFNIKLLNLHVVSNTLKLIGLLISLRFFEGIYRSCLMGLEKFILINKIQIIAATVRSLGSLLIIMKFSTRVDVFFLWQIIISLITLTSLFYSTLYFTGGLNKTRKFSLDSLRKNKNFSTGMFIHTLLVLALTQGDKIILSKLLTLSDFGYYNIATSVSGVVLMLVAPVTQIYLPRLIVQSKKNDLISLGNTFHEGSQLVTCISGSFSILFLFFSKLILLLWLKDTLVATNLYLILSVLVAANFLNGLLWMPNTLQFASKYTQLTIRSNLFALLIYLPLLFIFVPIYGALGASILWLLINILLLFFSIYYFMFKKFIPHEKNKWLIKDIVYPCLILVIIGYLFHHFSPFSLSSISQLILLFSLFCTSLIVTLLTSHRTRDLFLRTLIDFKRNKQ